MTTINDIIHLICRDNRIRRLRLEYDALCSDRWGWSADWIPNDKMLDENFDHHACEVVGPSLEDVLRQVCEALKIEVPA